MGCAGSSATDASAPQQKSIGADEGKKAASVGGSDTMVAFRKGLVREYGRRDKAAKARESKDPIDKELTWNKVMEIIPNKFSSILVHGALEGPKIIQGKVNEAAQPFGERTRFTKANAKEGGTEPTLAALGCGLSCKKGQKPGQFDPANQDDFAIFRIDDDGIYAVYDGHGSQGEKVSALCTQYLIAHMLVLDDLPRDPDAALKSTFAYVEAKLADSTAKAASDAANKGAVKKTPELNALLSGTTATVVIAWGGLLHVANVGDSRAVLAVGSSASTLVPRVLTEDHRPDEKDPAEKNRVEAAGAELKNKDGKMWRIYTPGKRSPGIALTRSIGDEEAKLLGVNAEPYLTGPVPISKDSKFVVLASDGLWDHATNEEVINVIAKCGKNGVDQAMEELQTLARSRWLAVEDMGGLCDDITIICVWLNDLEPEVVVDAAETTPGETPGDSVLPLSTPES